jgi:hypothetical protein
MPLFGFGDIQFNKSPNASNRPKGPLSVLSDSPFKANYLKYPMDVGAADKGHYMLIYIKKQNTSDLIDSPQQDALSQASSTVLNNTNTNLSIQEQIKTRIGGELSQTISNTVDKIDNATGGIATKVGNAFKNVAGALGTNRVNVLNGNQAATQSIINRNIKSLQTNGGKLSTTTRTGDVIALYMPDTLQFDFGQNYEDLSLTRNLAGLVGVAAAEQLVEGGDKEKFLDAVKAVGARVAGEALGDIGRAGAFLTFGGVVNPMLEVIYNSPKFRSFDYIFKFYPRDEREAIEVQKIINMLQFHQAPEIKTDGSISMLIPPSEFDIKFYYGGKENENIPKIGSCVLKNIQINYAPNGWAAYEVPGQEATLGGTGMPVGIEMTLQFQEVVYLTKNIDPANSISQRQKSQTQASQRGEYGSS